MSLQISHSRYHLPETDILPSFNCFVSMQLFGWCIYWRSLCYVSTFKWVFSTGVVLEAERDFSRHLVWLSHFVGSSHCSIAISIFHLFVILCFTAVIFSIRVLIFVTAPNNWGIVERVILCWFKLAICQLYTKKKVKHPHVFLKWQMIRQVSRDYWPDNLNNAMVTC